MALTLRTKIANDLLCETTCGRRKATQETIHGRVKAWKEERRNKQYLPALDNTSRDISRLRDPVTPDKCWEPDLQKTLAAQLCAIHSALDMLKNRGCKNAKCFGSVLGKTRSYYANPCNWPLGLADDHMTIILAILKYTIAHCHSHRAGVDPPVKHKACICYGTIAEALEQAFLFRKKDIKAVSLLTGGLFKAFILVYEDARVRLFHEMKRTRNWTGTPLETAQNCMSTLGEAPRNPPGGISLLFQLARKRKSGDHKDETPLEANRGDRETPIAEQLCACHSVIRKIDESNRNLAARKQKFRAKVGNQATEPHLWTSTPSPLGQFVETAG